MGVYLSFFYLFKIKMAQLKPEFAYVDAEIESFKPLAVVMEDAPHNAEQDHGAGDGYGAFPGLSEASTACSTTRRRERR